MRSHHLRSNRIIEYPQSHCIDICQVYNTPLHVMILLSFLQFSKKFLLFDNAAMSAVRNFFSRVIGSNKEQPKKLLSGTDGNLFHTLILAYVRIYLLNQELIKEGNKSPSPSKLSRRSRKASSKNAPQNEENEEKEEQDPTAVLLSILTIMPKISNEKLEDECIASDLLQFLKIICHQFTNNILTIDDQERIGFYEPHLQSPDSLPPSIRKQKGVFLCENAVF